MKINIKTIALIFFIAFTMKSNAYFIKVYSRTTSNPGENGYAWVHKVEHDDIFFVKMTFIECKNPGELTCPTTVGPSPIYDNVDILSINELVNLADVSISGGTNSGSSNKVVYIPGSNVYRVYVVTWSLNTNGEILTEVTKEEFTI